MRALLRSPTGRAKTIPPIHPNLGVTAAYHRRLMSILREMQDSLSWFLRAAYRKVEPEPEPIAQDRDPAVLMRETMDRLARRWRKRLDEAADDLARSFVRGSFQHADRAFAKKLASSGFVVKFEPTAYVKTAMRAAVAENVGLIKSIGEQHLAQVQGDVMRAVMAGRDLGTLTKTLQERYGLTTRRAAFVARDQSAKLTSVVTRARRQELGLTQAIWTHSAGGRHPRESHVKAGRDRLRFDVSRGAYIDGEWIQPGELPNCRCVSAVIVPGFDD